MFRCGYLGCSRTVTGIYCPEHRKFKLEELDRIREERSLMMKERWKNNREAMVTAIAAGRAKDQGPD